MICRPSPSLSRRNLMLALALVALPGPASAKSAPERVIDAGRVRLGDVVRKAPAELEGLDVAPAPAPGGSRVFSRRDVLLVLDRADIDTSGIEFFTSVRVRRAAKAFSPAELSRLIEPALRAAMPEGIRLVSITPPRAIQTAPTATAGAVKLSQFARRAGTARSTAVVELLADGEPVTRVAVSFTAEVTEQALREDVERGAQLELAIDSGAVRVTAAGVAMQDGDVGDVISCQVVRTRKVLRARIESARVARVELK